MDLPSHFDMPDRAIAVDLTRTHALASVFSHHHDDARR